MLRQIFNKRILEKVPNMRYSEKVLQHFNNPKNVGTLDKNDPNVGTAIVGAPACGDVMKLQIKVDENDNIVDTKFKTFGCASAISSSSYATDFIKNKKLDDAEKITNKDISSSLNLPPVKIHCSVLAEDAIKMAIKDVKEKRCKNHKK